MRTSPALTLALLLLSPSAAGAQIPPGGGRWWAGLALEGIHFAESLTDTLAPSAIAAGLRPDGRVGLGALLSRSYRHWRAELEVGWASGRVEAGNASVAIKDKTMRVTRWRLAVSADWRVARLGTGEIGLAAGPTLDWWSVGGSDRARAGAEARLALRVPLGGLELENRVALGVSGSPLRPDDAGAGFHSRTQVAITAGLALRLRL